MTNRNAASMGSYGASWQHLNYAGSGNVEPLLDSLKGRVSVVCGSATGVFEEYNAARNHFGPDIVTFAANDVGMFLPRLDHWVSLHGSKIYKWKAVRWANDFNDHTERISTHSNMAAPEIDYWWDGLTPTMALSGYFAMQIAFLMGSDLIVLCGCPGNSAPRFFECASRKDFDYANGVKEQIIGEAERVPSLKERTRSMSGWTKEFFGGINA